MSAVRNVALLTGAVLALAACNREPSGQPDDFAERLGANKTAAAPQAGAGAPATMSPEQIAAERERAEQNGALEAPAESKSANKLPYADLIVPPSVQLDAKAAEPCRALAMTEYLGQPDSPDLRQKIAAANKAACA
jgi:hypothetical protein